MDKLLTLYAKRSKKAVYNISMPKLVKVVFDIPVNDSFDYISDNEKVKIGSRVKVSFGNTTRIGVMIDIITVESKQKKYKLKKIHEIIDKVPILSKEMLKTCKWAASYYHHPLGQVIFSAMTPLHRKQRKEPTSSIVIQCNDSDRELTLNSDQNKIYNSLNKDKDNFKVNVIRGVTGSGKTELYVKLAERCIQENSQVLVMVPEINLIPQTIERFQKYLKSYSITISFKFNSNSKVQSLEIMFHRGSVYRYWDKIFSFFAFQKN